MKYISNLAKATVSVVIFSLLALACGMFWLAEGTRDLEPILPSIQNYFSNRDIKVTLSQAISNWNSTYKQFDLVFDQVRITDQHSGSELFSTPKMSISVSPIAVLSGNFTTEIITIESPKLDLDSIALNTAPSADLSLNSLSKSLISKLKKFRNLPIKMLEANNVQLKTGNELYNIDISRLAHYNKNQSYITTLEAEFIGPSKTGMIKANISIPSLFSTDPTALVQLECAQFPILGSLFGYPHTQFDVSGRLNTKFNLKGHLSNLELDIQDLHGNIDSKDVVAIKALSAHLSGNQELLTLHDLHAQLGKHIDLNISASLANFRTLTSVIELTNLPVDLLEHLWPREMAIDTREWAVDRINKGIISKAVAKLNIKLDDLLQGKLPSNSLSAEMDIGGASLNYYEGLPTIQSINGKLTFTSEDLNIKVSKAILGTSHIQAAQIHIPYNGPITVGGLVTGNIQDVIDFVPSETIKNAERDNINLKDLVGTAKTTINAIKIPVSSDMEFEDIEFDIQSQLSNVELANLPNNAYLSQGQLSASFNGATLEIKGEGKLDGNNSSINWTGYLSPNAQYDTILKLDTTLLPETLPQLKFMEERFFQKGKIAINTTITSKNHIDHIVTKAILDDAELRLGQIGFLKPVGKKAMANITAIVPNDKIIKIDNITIDGEDLYIKGKAELSKALLLVNSAHFEQIHYNHGNASVDYDATTYGYKMNISGNGINLSDANFAKLFSSADQPAEELKEEQLDINLSNITMKNGINFSKINGNITCNRIGGCSLANFDITMKDNSKLKIDLTPTSPSQSNLTIISNNAAAVSNAFDIYKNVRNGDLNISGIRTNPAGSMKSKFTGEVLLTNFTAIKTGVLTKILSFFSLPGVMKLLTGEQISFDKFKIDFTMEDSLITTQNGKVEGGQIGLTMAGTINFKTHQLNLSGIVIPDLFYANKLVSSIPLLGTLLGGKDGGFIAANYKIYGPFDKVDTSLNPLSFLPIIRGFFSLFDKKEEPVTPEKVRPTGHT